MRRTCAAIVLLTGFAPLSSEAPPTARVPLCAGLTIVTAVSASDGDYESIKTVASVSDTDVVFQYSSEIRENGVTLSRVARRRVRAEDLQRATLFQRHFTDRGALTIPRTTAVGTSAAVL